MTVGMLESIHSPADVQALSPQQLESLCGEIRSTLLDYGLAYGGHIGSNLGIVELTVALHHVFDSPKDRFIFDVSHQSYVHKMLTGRAYAYTDETRFGEVTGFTNPEESEHDSFVLGHTGTSISLACGLAKARDLMAGTAQPSGIGNVVAIIGDGALSSATAFEGLNNAAEQGGNIIIIVNDNEMSIAEDFGGMYGPLAKLRRSGGTAQPNLFEAFGLDYRYVERGNDVNTLVEELRGIKDIDHPIVLHVHTEKGLGFAEATETQGDCGDGDPASHLPYAGRCEANHWQDPQSDFAKPLGARKYYGQMAMAALEARFEKEPGLTVISPATPRSNGITRDWRRRAGNHYVDTGIAEEHAAAFAAGIAKAGGRPVLATSATFFQRMYDQLHQELALNHVPATLLIFGSGISGTDNTHSGAFDIAQFSNIPDMTCLAPTSGEQMLDMLAWATGPAEHGVVAIRMPGESILQMERDSLMAFDPVERAYSYEPIIPATGSDESCPFTHYQILKAGKDIAILSLGDSVALAAQVAGLLDDDPKHHNTTLVSAAQYSTLDEEALTMLASGHRIVVTLENGQLEGGWGHKISAFYTNARNEKANAVRVLNFGAAKEFTDRVPLAELDERYGLTPEQIVSRIERSLATL